MLKELQIKTMDIKTRQLRYLLWDMVAECIELQKLYDEVTTSDLQGMEEATINSYILKIKKLKI